MSSSSSSIPWGSIFIIGGIVLFIMWLCDAGPFEKPYVPTSTYTMPSSTGSNVSFGSSHSPGSYTVNAYFQDGSYACRVTVKNGLAYPNGSTHGNTIHSAGYGDPGAHWCFWAHSIIYF